MNMFGYFVMTFMFMTCFSLSPAQAHTASGLGYGMSEYQATQRAYDFAMQRANRECGHNQWLPESYFKLLNAKQVKQPERWEVKTAFRYSCLSSH